MGQQDAWPLSATSACHLDDIARMYFPNGTSVEVRDRLDASALHKLREADVARATQIVEDDGAKLDASTRSYSLCTTFMELLARLRI